MEDIFREFRYKVALGFGFLEREGRKEGSKCFPGMSGVVNLFHKLGSNNVGYILRGWYCSAFRITYSITRLQVCSISPP